MTGIFPKGHILPTPSPQHAVIQHKPDSKIEILYACFCHDRGRLCCSVQINDRFLKLMRGFWKSFTPDTM